LRDGLARFGAAVLLAMVVSSQPEGAVRAAGPDVATNRKGKPSQEDSAVSCTPERPTAMPGETIHAHAWFPASNGQREYAWSATGGRLNGRESEASWNFAGVKPGTYTATVSVNGGGGGGGDHSITCSMRVIVLKHGEGRGLFTRVTGHSVLAPGALETRGYGLYSYILFGNPPDEASRDRYTKTIEAYLSLIPDLNALEKYAKPIELNATYVPIDSIPPMSVSPEWVLHHYDYARAVVLLRALPGSHADGPYIVSSLKPLTGGESLTTDYLLQNLSSVPPDLVADWVKLFINQASQQNFWETQSASVLARRLRTAVGVRAIGLPEVQKSLTGWISWSRSVSGT
jgi:hypothetical protein